ncbi:hypothetical protein AB0368_06640 [Actinoplanes sp. NPDC051475]|uniref:hypothetical protein n=1 Tax=Actinoplanes sp. NPDC051475 TaxID=3157225 RepID=UPI00344F357D
MSRLLGRLLHAAAGAALLGALLCGTPWFLLRYLDNPLPAQWPSPAELGELLLHGYDTDFFTAALTLAIWLFWARFAILLCIELARTVHDVIHYREPRQIARTGLRAVAAFVVTALVGAVLFDLARAMTAHTGTTTGGVAPAPLAAIATAHQQQPHHLAAAVYELPASAQTTPIPGAGHGTLTAVPVALHAVGVEPSWVSTARDEGHGIHKVKRGDSLWSVAEDRLGDGHRWRQIYVATRDLLQPTGQVLTDPSDIRAGWYLILPDAADATDGTDGAPGSAEDAPSDAAADPTDDGVTPDATETAPGTDDAAPRDAPAETDPPADQHADHTGHHTVAGVSLPRGGWIDAGLAAALIAAVALIWAQRRRRLTRTAPADDPGAQPMPQIVSHVRRGLRHTAPISHGERNELHAYKGFFDALHAAAAADTAADARHAAAEAARQPVLGADSPVTWAPHRTLDIPAGHPGDDQDLDSAAPQPESEQSHDWHDNRDGDEDDGWDAYGDDPDDAPYEQTYLPTPATPALGGRFDTMWPAPGLGLTGPAAHAAARGFLISALAAGPEDYNARATVVIASGTLATLLGAAAVSIPRTPRLITTIALSDALDLLEEEMLRRTRVVYEYDAEDVPAVRASDPYVEAMPPMVLIADTTTHADRARIAAILTQAQRLDIHGILLGEWTAGDTVHVAPDGATHRAEQHSRHGAHPADISRLTVIDADEAADLLRLLGEAHTGDTPPPAADLAVYATARADTHPGHTAGDSVAAPSWSGGTLTLWPEADPGGVAGQDVNAPIHDDSLLQGQGGHDASTTDLALAPPAELHDDMLEMPVPSDAATPLADAIAAALVPADTDTHAGAGSPDDTIRDEHPADDRDDTAVLDDGNLADSDTVADSDGTPAGDTPDTLADSDAATDAAQQSPEPNPEPGDHPSAEDATPDAPPTVRAVLLGTPRILDVPAGEKIRKQAIELLVYLAVRGGSASRDDILDDLLPDAPMAKAPTRLHTMVYSLRRLMKLAAGDAEYLDNPAQRYVLNPHTLDCDVWRMRAALAEADAATTSEQRITALRAAVDAYTGPLADGCAYDWVEPYRYAVAQEAAGAALRLAQEFTDQPEQARTILAAAIEHHPHTEELYQAAMRVAAMRGDVDAVRALKKQVTHRIDELDCEPTSETLTIAADSIAAATRHARKRPGSTR